MNEKFPHLFEPIKIGKTTVKNRIFMPPISTNMADKGYVTDALVEHYSARAKVHVIAASYSPQFRWKFLCQ